METLVGLLAGGGLILIVVIVGGATMWNPRGRRFTDRHLGLYSLGMASLLGGMWLTHAGGDALGGLLVIGALGGAALCVVGYVDRRAFRTAFAAHSKRQETVKPESLDEVARMEAAKPEVLEALLAGPLAQEPNYNWPKQ